MEKSGEVRRINNLFQGGTLLPRRQTSFAPVELARISKSIVQAYMLPNQ